MKNNATHAPERVTTVSAAVLYSSLQAMAAWLGHEYKTKNRPREMKGHVRATARIQPSLDSACH